MMKNRTAIFLLCLVLAGLLTGCGKGELTDGTYTVEVALTGGSGRASVETPAQLEVEGESRTVILRWGSPYYEYMLVDGVRYEPIQEEGNSTFRIPVVLDTDMTVSASTIAMSQPHLVDYTLRFDSGTIQTP